MDFARFPWTVSEENEEGFDLQIRDLRFYSNYGGRGFLAEIELDKALRVRSESFSFSAQIVEKSRSRGVEVPDLRFRVGAWGHAKRVEELRSRRQKSLDSSTFDSRLLDLD
jgi:hypothetical protein